MNCIIICYNPPHMTSPDLESKRSSAENPKLTPTELARQELRDHMESAGKKRIEAFKLYSNLVNAQKRYYYPDVEEDSVTRNKRWEKAQKTIYIKRIKDDAFSTEYREIYYLGADLGNALQADATSPETPTLVLKDRELTELKKQLNLEGSQQSGSSLRETLAKPIRCDDQHLIHQTVSGQVLA